MDRMLNKTSGWHFISRLRPYGIGLLFVAASTLIGLLIAPRWGNSAVDLLYLPAILGAAVIAGRRPALMAALVSALAFNFFFTAPYYSFRIHSPSDIVTVIVLFIVAVVASHLVASIRHQADIAAAHAARNATIAGLARNLISCSTQGEIGNVACRQLAEIFDCNTVLVSGRPTPEVISSVPPDNRLTPTDVAAAVLVLQTGEPAGRGLAAIAPAEWQFHAIRTESSVVAAMGLARNDAEPPVAADKLILLQNLLDQVALALDRARLEQERSF